MRKKMYAATRRLATTLAPLAFVLLLAHEVFSSSVYSDKEIVQLRLAFVELARQGQTDQAIEKLEALSEAAPADLLVWGDYLSVLTQSGRHREALTAFTSHADRPLPGYALADLFGAAVAQRDAALALRFAGMEISQSAEPQSLAATRMTTLAKLDAAFEQQKRPAEVQPVTASTKSVATPPRPHAKRKSTPVTRVKERAAHRSKPTSLMQESSSETGSLALAERARNAVRRAEDAPPGEREQQAREALARLDDYESTLRLSSSTVALRSAQLDRVRALTLAGDIDDAANLFEQLRASGPMPAYALLHGADIYARKGTYDQALIVLDEAERENPLHRDILISKFRIYLDTADYERADRVLTALRGIASSPAEKRDCELWSARLDAYSDKLSAAQATLEALRDAEPHAADVQLQLAQVYRWRGWHRRALDAYSTAALSDDAQKSALLGKAATLTELNEPARARETLASISSAYALDPDFESQRVDISVRTQWEYEARMQAGNSDTNPITGSGEMVAEQQLWSPALTDNVRAFVRNQHASIQFSDATDTLERTAIGIDYRDSDARVTIAIQDRSSADHLGASVSGEHYFSDTVTAFGEIQSDSDLVPQRALRESIDGNSASAGVRYRVDETFLSQMSYSRTEFSDGNDRDTVAARAESSRLYGKRHRVDLVLDAYHSSNTRGDDAPYFNPSEEIALGATLHFSGPVQATGIDAWTHHLAIGAGLYEQASFGATGIWDIEYEQHLQINKQLQLTYGALWRSRVYDGAREDYTALTGRINWHF